jgi:hypothetical protein
VFSADATYRFNFITINDHAKNTIQSLPASFDFVCNNQDVDNDPSAYYEITPSSNYLDIHIKKTIDSACQILPSIDGDGFPETIKLKVGALILKVKCPTLPFNA